MDRERLIDILSSSVSGVGFTGAGASEESGIPTFRDPGGVWDRFNVAEVGTAEGLVNTLMRNPQKFSEFLEDLVETFKRAKPNPCHTVLSRMQKMGIVKHIITQNIDNLHQQGGSENVIELHGNLYELRCINCMYTVKEQEDFFFQKFNQLIAFLKSGDLDGAVESIPRCSRCNGIMRPNVVMFGEPVHNLQESYRVSRKADLFIIIGTSGVVYPAAYLPRLARENGAKIIEINPNGPFFPDIVDIFIKEKAGVAMMEIQKTLNELDRQV